MSFKSKSSQAEKNQKNKNSFAFICNQICSLGCKAVSEKCKPIKGVVFSQRVLNVGRHSLFLCFLLSHDSSSLLCDAICMREKIGVDLLSLYYRCINFFVPLKRLNCRERIRKSQKY